MKNQVNIELNCTGDLDFTKNGTTTGAVLIKLSPIFLF